MKQYTHLVWDFNGTLLNDVLSDFHAANRLLVRHGLAPMENVERYREVFGFPVIDYYHRLGFDCSEASFSSLAAEWWEDYRHRAEKAELYPEIPRILREMKRSGVPQIVLSATEEKMLEKQVEDLGIAGLFAEIIGADNVEGRGKADLAKLWRERNPKAVPLMVGDTDHDAETARAMGADIILLTCGHQSREKLEKANPLMVCERPETIPFALLFRGKFKE